MAPPRTGLSPASYRDLVAQLRHVDSFVFMAPELLDALPRIIAGKSCQVIGDVDAFHSWNYTGDVARTLVTCAQDERSWGRAWHAPANPPRTVRDAIGDIARIVGATNVKIAKVPTIALRVLGLISTDVRELPKTLYQFEAPFVIDDSETRSTFGLQPTPWDEVLTTAIEFYSQG